MRDQSSVAKWYSQIVDRCDSVSNGRWVLIGVSLRSAPLTAGRETLFARGASG
jgi:isochorismate synthase EntC